VIKDRDIVLRSKRPCGLYVHVPFCETKCGYCDFFSVALKGRNPAPLVGRLIRELDWRTEDVDCISTVFVGGGTPTLLPIDLLKELLSAIGKRVRVDALDEFTVEANPATVHDAKAELLVESGVSRVSMGAQSFHVAELATLERLHSPGDIAPSVETLRRCGIGQVNLDLIFGIPGQTMASWLESLRRAIELGPDHIACYGLTYEPATRLTAQRNTNRLTPCDEDLEAEMFLATVDTLAAAGYEQYEISNYARPGCESRHNLIYWRNEPYIGVGPSAAGCVPVEWGATPGGSLTKQGDSEISTPLTCGRGTVGDVSRRHKNVADIAGYVRMMDQHGHAEVEAEIIEGETLMLEMILMQLRLNEGLSVPEFRRRTGHDPDLLFGGALPRLRASGLVTSSSKRIVLTRAGFLQANYVISELAAALTTDAAV
jgi:oxygen-independent coproporphyrinogen III oxidase